jgi:hypothetical protein
VPDSAGGSLWGKKTYQADSLREAIELAEGFRASGRYDWFRGQRREWPPHSSRLRVRLKRDDEATEAARKRLLMLASWALRIPELQYLVSDAHVHDFFAVAQHYGLPTDYIDFTASPAVAGFFAAEARDGSDDGPACIYCLDTDELRSMWKAVKDLDERRDARLETVVVDVRNLWRLEAQQGVFIYANYNWEVDYPLDRILFRCDSYDGPLERTRIYPVHKSPLELLLDQYFDLERGTQTAERIHKLIAKQKRAGAQEMGYTRLTPFPSGYFSEAFRADPAIAPLRLWVSALPDWDLDPEEQYQATVGLEVTLRAGHAETPGELRAAVARGLAECLDQNRGMRTRAVDWSFVGLPPAVPIDRLAAACRDIWNGMRRLPFTPTEVGQAFGTTAALLMGGFARTLSSDTERRLFEELFGPSLVVDFGYPDGSGSRGLIARQTLLEALREDMARLLVAKHRARAADPRELFRVVYNPSLTFEFRPFATAFAEQIIPTQALAERSPFLFNPARVATFGNP